MILCKPQLQYGHKIWSFHSIVLISNIRWRENTVTRIVRKQRCLWAGVKNLPNLHNVSQIQFLKLRAQTTMNSWLQEARVDDIALIAIIKDDHGDPSGVLPQKPGSRRSGISEYCSLLAGAPQGG